MVPDGDRRDSAKSGRTVDQNKPIAPGNKNVVREFILNDDFSYNLLRHHAWRLTHSPTEHIRKGSVVGQLRFYFRHLGGVYTCMISDLHHNKKYDAHKEFGL